MLFAGDTSAETATIMKIEFLGKSYDGTRTTGCWPLRCKRKDSTSAHLSPGSKWHQRNRFLSVSFDDQLQ
jgi:hypothetical protein